MEVKKPEDGGDVVAVSASSARWKKAHQVVDALKVVRNFKTFEKNMLNLSNDVTLNDCAKVYSTDYGRSTSENLISLVKKKVQDGEILNGRFLDIGAGPGAITNELSPLFDHTTVVDPNSDVHKAEYLKGYEVYQSDFQEVDFKDQDPYDFILCSLVLYYVPMDKWDAFLEKILTHLKEGGIAVVVMGTTTGAPYDIPSEFGEVTHTVEPILEYFEKREQPVEMKITKVDVSFDDNREAFVNYVWWLVATSGLYSSSGEEGFDDLDAQKKREMKEKCAEIAERPEYKDENGKYSLSLHGGNVFVKRVLNDVDGRGVCVDSMCVVL